MPVKKTLKPEPVSVETQCSVCGLDWKLHGKTPTLEDCIRVLKAELSKRALYPTVVPNPFPYGRGEIIRRKHPEAWEEGLRTWPRPGEITCHNGKHENINKFSGFSSHDEVMQPA